MSDAPGRPSSEGRPGACAVAPEPNAAQVGDHPVFLLSRDGEARHDVKALGAVHHQWAGAAL